MNPQELKPRLSAALQAFAGAPLRQAALHFFKELGYASDRTLPPCSVADFCTQFDPQGALNHASALKNDWQSADLLFQLTDEELSKTETLFKETSVAPSRAASYVFFAIELQTKDYSRSQLAAITRRLNRVFPMPVMVLYKMGDQLSIAVINRRAHKRDTDLDVLGKVTLIHHISAASPHRGHIDIIASFALAELAKTQPVHNFDTLHAAWEAVFNVELLNKRFYEELANWYFWARKQVRFPADLEPDEQTRNATSVIRLLTRLIFVWFLKEKNLIPSSLFDPEHLQTVLKDWQPSNGSFVGWASAHNAPPSMANVELKPTLPTTQAADTGTYYRAILQNLFFATLNQEMGADGKPSPRQFVTNDGHLSNRTHHGIKTLYRYDECFHSQAQALALFEDIPFLNGGLFACLDIENAANKVQYADGFTRSKTKQAHVPDALFFAAPHTVDLSEDYADKNKAKAPVRGLIHILNGYKFTINESTPVEQEIALDPELLGNVFENLLASYNPETGQSARKQTGSFYTPRPIVDYMVDEALKAYLAGALEAIPQNAQSVGWASAHQASSAANTDGGLKPTLRSEPTLAASNQAHTQQGLNTLFAYTDQPHPFNASETRTLIAAIDACNILDPACGSGAYPMGILHKLVFILGKLDPANAQWKQRQIDGVLALEDTTVRDDTLARIESDFADNNLDFGRKLYLIEKCIYGVDIQPIAIQIAKLRFFISLVCDQRIYKDRPNLGVRPLPNLEIKFVAANTLIALDLPQNLSLFDSPAVLALEKQLATVRHLYFSAKRREDKKRLKARDEALVEQIITELQSSGFAGDVAIRRARWSPYDAHGTAHFFDAGTMFGPSLKAGFDVVIGNPPYVQIQKFPAAQKQAWQAQGYATYGAMADIYCLFYERGAQLLREGGQLCYITSNKWMRAGYGEALRGWLASKVSTVSVFDFGMAQNFGAATTYTSIVHLCNIPFSASKATRPEPVEGQVEQKATPKVCYAEDAQAAIIQPADYFAANATPLTVSQEPWVILPPSRAKIKNAVSKQGIKLDKWDLRINYGIKTGYNEAFYLNDVQREVLIAADPRSVELIVPLMRGRNVLKYSTDWADLEGDDDKWLLFVPWHFPLHDSHDISGSSAKAEAAFKLQFPAAYHHLCEFKEILSARNVAETGIRYEWYAMQRWGATYRKDFVKPKIIYPNITKYMPFFYDENENFYANDANYIISSDSENLAALTAQLNSTLYRCCFKENFPELLGDSRKLGRVYFDQIPLKKPSAEQAAVLEGLVLRVQAAKKPPSVGWASAHQASMQQSADGGLKPTLQNPSTAATPAHETAFIEQWIDACVMQLYFAGEMASIGCDFFTPAAQLLPTCTTAASLYAAAADSKHPVRNGLIRLPIDSPDIFGVILTEGAV